MDVNSIISEAAITSLLTTAVKVIVIALLISIVVGIVCYIFQGIAFYHVVKRRNLHNPGLAWIPVGIHYSIGKIADDARLKNGAEKSCLRVWMLILSIVSLAAGIALFCLTQDFISQSYGIYDDSVIVSFAISLLLLSLISITLFVLMYIALFNIYRSLSEAYVVFFVLSIIFPITIPFFVFAVRKKDYWYGK